jgi:ribulose-bisphosphate carboxylase large chain
MYTDLSYRPKGDVVCRFRVDAPDIRKAAEALAGESSVGTWTEIKTSPRIQDMRARAFRIKGKEVWVAYPLALFEPGNIPQLLSSVAGNIFGMKVLRQLKLEDIYLPKKYVSSFKGPRHGIEGVRRLLRVKERPLIGTIVKPKLACVSRFRRLDRRCGHREG